MPRSWLSQRRGQYCLWMKANELYFELAKGEKVGKIKDIRLKMGKGVAGWVAKKGGAIDCP